MGNQWEDAKAAVLDKASEPCPYRPTLDPDTYLLAEHLQAAYQEALDEGVGTALAWYRVAERAKELRA